MAYVPPEQLSEQTERNLWRVLLDDAEERGKRHELGGVHLHLARPLSSRRSAARRRAKQPSTVWRTFAIGFVVLLVLTFVGLLVAGCGAHVHTRRGHVVVCEPVTIGHVLVVGERCWDVFSAVDGGADAQ